MVEESQPTGTLYPFPYRTSGKCEGQGGNLIVYNSDTRGTVYINGYGTYGTVNTVNNQSKKFTIPAGSTVILTAKLISFNGTTNNWQFACKIAGTSTVAIGGVVGNPNTVKDKTWEKTFDEDTDIGSAYFYHGGVGAVVCEITLTVNGVRYI